MDVRKIKEKVKELAEGYMSRYFEPAKEGTGAILPGRKGEEKPEGTEKIKKEGTSEGSRERLERLAKGLGIGGLSLLFTLARVGHARPLGVAFMCALSDYLPFSLGGVLLGSLCVPDPILFASEALAAFVCRLIISRYLGDKLFCEGIGMRIFASTFSGFVAGVIFAISDGLSLSSIIGEVVSTASAPLMTYVFFGITEKDKRFSLHYEAALLGVTASLVRALSDFDIFGISLGAAGAIIITLYFSKNGGALRGTVAGLVSALAYSSVYAPAFGIAGLISGVLFGKGAAFASAIGSVGAIIYGAYVYGIGSFASFVPGVILGCGIFAPLAQYKLIPSLPGLSKPEKGRKAFSGEAVGEIRMKAEAERLNAISDSLSSLSEVFYSLSDKLKRPGIYDVRLLCEKKFRAHCDGCALNSLCWDKEHVSSSDAITKLAQNITATGDASIGAIPEYMRSRCPHGMRIIGEINSEYARMLESSARQNRTEVFALDYEDMARLLRDASAENAAEFEIDEALSEKARKVAREMNFCASNVAVFGGRKKTVIAGGIDLSSLRIPTEQLRKRMSEAVGAELDAPRFDIDEDFATMTMTSKRILRAECARKSSAKKGERQNGDSSACFESREDRFYSLICDGMGSGSEAALTSRITGIFLSRMLSAGNRKSIVLQMLNNFIRNKNLECFSTVDLLEIDLITGRAGFVKSGAAPSYILRKGKLFRIASNSLPIGITREIGAEEISFGLEEGDLIVMISDGAAQGFEDSIWIAELLSEDDVPMDTEALAEMILERAAEKGERRDDVTVCAVKVASVG